MRCADAPRGGAGDATGTLRVRTKLAAAVTYYALLSMFPLAILVVAGFGLVIAEGDARTQVIDAILMPCRSKPDRVAPSSRSCSTP